MTTPTPTLHPPTCPKCGVIINACTAVDHSDALPYAGAVCICLNCGWVMLFDGDPLLPRDLRPDEQMSVLTDPDVMAALVRIALANRTRLQ